MKNVSNVKSEISRGYSLVELLAVLAIIGILTTATFTFYSSMQESTKNESITKQFKNAKDQIDKQFTLLSDCSSLSNARVATGTTIMDGTSLCGTATFKHGFAGCDTFTFGSSGTGDVNCTMTVTSIPAAACNSEIGEWLSIFDAARAESISAGGTAITEANYLTTCAGTNGVVDLVFDWPKA